MGLKLCAVLCTVLVAILAASIGGLFAVLQIPENSEAVTRKLAHFGGVPSSFFDQMKVKDKSVWFDIVTKNYLGLGEAYMNGAIEIKDLDKFFMTLLNGTSVGTKRAEGFTGLLRNAITLYDDVTSRLMEKTTEEKQQAKHYEAGIDFYKALLGPTMSDSSGYWKGAKTLEEAQENKWNLIMRKLQLKPGMKVMDLSMGWGTGAAYMHKNANVKVYALSSNWDKITWARENLYKPGMAFLHYTNKQFCDDPGYFYTFDRVYAVGLFESSGRHSYLFKCMRRLLKPGGLALVQMNGQSDLVDRSDSFVNTHITPGTQLPSISSIAPAFESYFVLEDLQNFGADYAPTIKEWTKNAEAFFKKNPDAKPLSFQRKIRYWLSSQKTLAELRILSQWHLVLTPRPATNMDIERLS